MVGSVGLSAYWSQGSGTQNGRGQTAPGPPVLSAGTSPGGAGCAMPAVELALLASLLPGLACGGTPDREKPWVGLSGSSLQWSEENSLLHNKALFPRFNFVIASCFLSRLLDTKGQGISKT